MSIMNMLMTGIQEIETTSELEKIISENENVMVCCGRMGPMCKGFMGLPFTVYYKNGEMVKATTSIQSRDQIVSILDEKFGK